jgi:hypothetical protein
MADTKLKTTDTTPPRVAHTLGLKVPEQAPAPADSFLLDVRETAAWIAGLPMANIGETARQIYCTLLDFNRYQLPELLRAKLVEQFREPVAYICQNLRRHYLDMGLPLSEKAWKTATLSRELNNQLAIAYKIIIESLLSGSSERFDRKLMVITVHRAMYYLGEVMLHTTLLYSPWPKGLWREINSLFAFALHNRVHQVPIKMKLEDGEEISTIEDRYKALLLLATSTPQRMRQSHINQLYADALQWAGSTHILVGEHASGDNGRFNLSLMADSPPVHNALRAPEQDRRTLVLDLRPLLKQLRERFESAPLDASPTLSKGKRPLTRPLLRQLIMAWNRPPERRFVRTKLKFELNILCGLPTVFSRLASEPGENPPDASPARETASTAPFHANTAARPGMASRDNMLDMIGASGLSLSPINDASLTGGFANTDSYLNTKPGAPQADLIDEPAGQTTLRTEPGRLSTVVTTANESAGGYCIHWPVAQEAPKVKIGELLGRGSSTHRKHYGLGVVRWIGVHNSQSLDLGVQLLSSQVEAAHLRVPAKTTQRQSGTATVNCLLLSASENAAASDAPSLLVSSSSFPVGASLLMSHGGQERPIRLTRLVENSSAFAQFQFAYTPAGQAPEDNSATGDVFDDLWNSL